MAFYLPVKIKLDKYGKEYKDSYLLFKSLSWSEIQNSSKRITKAENTVNETIKILGEKFLEGKFWDFESKKNIDLKKRRYK